MIWEYKIVDFFDTTLSDREQKLNELGKDGWMIVSVDSPVVYLMRQVDEHDDIAEEPYYR